MLRILALAVLTLSTPAFAKGGAPTKDAIAAQKDATREAKAFSRKLDRYARKWEKGVDKGSDRKVARYDEKLGDLYRLELARLRSLGVPTRVEAPLPEHPQHPRPDPVPENPKLEDLRDTVVALRDLQAARAGSADVKPKERRLLQELQASAAKRYERKDRRLDAAKARG